MTSQEHKDGAPSPSSGIGQARGHSATQTGVSTVRSAWEKISEQLTSIAAAKTEKDVFLDWQKHRNSAVSLLEQTSRIFAAQYADESTLRVAEALLARFKMYDDQCTLLMADAERAAKNLTRILPRVKGCMSADNDMHKEIVYDIQLIVKAYNKDIKLFEKAVADLAEADKIIEDAEQKLPCGTKIKFEGVRVMSVSTAGNSSPNALPAPSSASSSSASSSLSPPSSTVTSPVVSPRSTSTKKEHSDKQSEKEVKASILEAGVVVCVLAVDQGLAVVLLSGGITTQKLVGASAAKHSFPFLIANMEVQRLLQQYVNEFAQCHRYVHARLKQLKSDVEMLEQLISLSPNTQGASPGHANADHFEPALARLTELISLYSTHLANKREIFINTPSTESYVHAALNDPSVHHLLQVSANKSLASSSTLLLLDGEDHVKSAEHKPPMSPSSNPDSID